MTGSSRAARLALSSNCWHAGLLWLTSVVQASNRKVATSLCKVWLVDSGEAVRMQPTHKLPCAMNCSHGGDAVALLAVYRLKK